MISVCIATYNGEKYIKEQLDSILCQLGLDDEIVISDDGSTDKTIDIIKSYNDVRIKIFHNQKDNALFYKRCESFLFTSKNFENAINKSSGNYIYLSDQDDIWDKERIKETLPLLENYDLVLCNYNVINKEGNIIIENFYIQNPINHSLLKNIIRIPFMGCCMSFKRNTLEYCLPFPKYCITHDNWIGCLILNLGNCVFITKPLHFYRKHGGNVSPTTSKSKNPFWFKVWYRIIFLYQLLKRIFQYKNKKKSQCKTT